MARRKKLEVERDFGSGIKQFVDNPPPNVFIPQDTKDKAIGNTGEPSPLDDSEIVCQTAETVNMDLERKLEELESKYVSVLDERDTLKKKYEELLKEKSSPKNPDIELLTSEFNLKEAILKSRIEELENKLSEKAYTNSDNRPIVPKIPRTGPIIDHGFSSGTFSTTKINNNGYEEW